MGKKIAKKRLKSAQDKGFSEFKGFKKVIEFANARKEDTWAHDDTGWVRVPGEESPPIDSFAGMTKITHSFPR